MMTLTGSPWSRARLGGERTSESTSCGGLPYAAAMSRFPNGPPPRRGVLDSLGYFYHFATNPVRFVEERFTAYGDIYYAPSPDGGLYVLKHPDHLTEVLLTHAAKYRKTHTAFQLLSRFLGDGLLTSDGDTWKRQRRM